MEFISRLAVGLGYVGVALNASLQIARTSPPWHRRWSLLAMIPPAVFWILFYSHVTWGPENGPGVLAQWSRMGHSLTIGAFLAQQFLIQAAVRRQTRALFDSIEQITVTTNPRNQ